MPQAGFEKWAVIACDQFATDKEYWKRVAHTIGDGPSTYRFIIPEAFLNEIEQGQSEVIVGNMVKALSDYDLRRLKCGGVFIKRRISTGIRYGILVAIDLEQFSLKLRDGANIIASESVIPERLSVRITLREKMPLEFSHSMLFFEDKQDRIMKKLASMTLKPLYSFDLMESGGHIEGFFLTEEHLNWIDSTISFPIFVADGNHSLAAAKIHWETLKAQLTEEQYENHPARFYLSELVNIYSKSVRLYPIHRLISKIDEEHFCVYFSKNMPCERNGHSILLNSSNKFAVLERADELLEQYVLQYGGKIEYIHDDGEYKQRLPLHAMRIRLKSLSKKEMLLHLKSGKLLPKKAFSIGKAIEKRYYLEGKSLKI